MSPNFYGIWAEYFWPCDLPYNFFQDTICLTPLVGRSTGEFFYYYILQHHPVQFSYYSAISHTYGTLLIFVVITASILMLLWMYEC